MVKRMAKDLGDEGSADRPRRSSRRIASVSKANDIEEEVIQEEEPKAKKPSKKAVVPTPLSKPATPNGATPNGSSSPRQYWLMKAEPESRFEKGQDVKFSIDDLAAKTEPEPWDGIRAYPARNNLRGMKKGDLSFFYHSSCKIPAIVGIMEIVEEHSPDVTAHDPSAPYHDASSTPENPKWSVVHVVFRQKLKTPITLKDLRAFQAAKDSPLANMQMLKLTRLSVSKVTSEEWDFIVSVMRDNGEEILS